jgi:hypothetical protein
LLFLFLSSIVNAFLNCRVFFFYRILAKSMPQIVAGTIQSACPFTVKPRGYSATVGECSYSAFVNECYVQLLTLAFQDHHDLTC